MPCLGPCYGPLLFRLLTCQYSLLSITVMPIILQSVFRLLPVVQLLLPLLSVVPVPSALEAGDIIECIGSRISGSHIHLP